MSGPSDDGAPDAGPLGRLRAICLALPEAAERDDWGEHRAFHVRGKTFAWFLNNHHGDGRVALNCKAPPGAQEILVGADPARFFAPPYVGHHGWLGVRLDLPATDWEEIAAIVTDSYRMTAPKRLAALLDRP
jgi:hypothetical protein